MTALCVQLFQRRYRVASELLDPMQLTDVSSWVRTLRPPGNVQSYLRQEVGASKTYVVARLLWPDFIEVRGCILRRDGYDAETFENWWQAAGGDP